MNETDNVTLSDSSKRFHSLSNHVEGAVELIHFEGLHRKQLEHLGEKTMKQLLQRISLLMVVVLALVGCSSNGAEEQVNPSEQTTNEPTESNVEELSVQLEVINDGKTEVKEVAFTEGENALEVTIRELNAVEEGGFVTTINGVVAGEETKTYWALSVNGEMSMVGAAEVTLKDGDKITWELSSY